MFESITFSTQNKSSIKQPLDIGRLVESMLFYEHVTVVATQAILTQLISFWGVERLKVLIDANLLRVVYIDSNVGIITNTINNVPYHEVVEFTTPQKTYQDVIREVCVKVVGKSGKGRRLAQRIEDKIQVTTHDRIILDGARHSILDQNYILAAVKLLIKETVPEITDVNDVVFQTAATTKGIEIQTNLDFTALNSAYHKKISPQHSSLSPSYILANLVDVESELYFSSLYLSELASSALNAKFAEQKINYLIAKSKKSANRLNNFTGFLFNDAKALSEAVNTGQVNLDDLVTVLLNSKRFKKWLTGLSPDADLIKNYYAEVTNKSFVEKLPGKSVRWVLFTGLGLTADGLGLGGYGTAMGMAIGALDTFYVDKLISGWKPSNFIENDVKKLLS